MHDDEKLKIALEALLELSNYEATGDDDICWMRLAAWKALLEIQRDNYLGTPSPVVAEVLGARRYL